MTLANKLTLSRLLVALLTFGCLWLKRPPFYLAALVLYLFATATDWVDGWVARRSNEVSSFGAMADPIADKVLVIGALLAFLRDPLLDIPEWAVFLIVVRELLQGGLRALAGINGMIISADWGGKWKMAIQSVSVLIIIIILAARSQGLLPADSWVLAAPYHLVVLSMVVAVLSGAQYIYNARHVIRKSWSVPRRARSGPSRPLPPAPEDEGDPPSPRRKDR